MDKPRLVVVTGDDLRDLLDKRAALESRNKQLEASLRSLVREARNVADDHHSPRYTRLDEAIASALNVLVPNAGLTADTEVAK